MDRRFVITNERGAYWNGGHRALAKWVDRLEDVSPSCVTTSINEMQRKASLYIGESIRCVPNVWVTPTLGTTTA